MKKIGFSLVLSVLIFSLLAAPLVRAENTTLVLDVRTKIALRAAQLAVKSMPGIYSWEEFRSCSSFVSAYLRQLSFPVDGLQGQYEEYGDPFPWSNVVSQVNWIRRNASSSVQDASLIDFLEGKLWSKIKPGDLVYLQKAEGHNGYNTYYHVVVLVGYLSDGSPQFAEISSGKEASFERSFDEVTNFYYKDVNGKWNVKPYKTGSEEELKVTWFDPLEFLNGGLWLRPGVVTPNSEVLSDKFSTIVTVNLYDGTTAVFEKTSGIPVGWKRVSIGGRKTFFAVTGRKLPANRNIGEVFFQSHEQEIYDSDFGVFISQEGVYQHTWTPQLISRLETFSVISGFGGLNGATDTAIMRPLKREAKGQVTEAVNRSPFTIHQIPNVVNQDMLLRQDLLEVANDPGNKLFGAIPVPKGNLSSGCVNYDSETWSLLKGYLKQRLDEGVGVVFSYPGFDQDLILGFDITKSPFIGNVFFKWCPESGKISCDSLDRSAYRDTYLDEQEVE
ncbi:MAG: amidase domain-containing protein [Microgenomates group bacterium]